MSIYSAIQGIRDATASEFDDFTPPFSTVTIKCEGGGDVKIFLPPGTAQSVADAINEAVAKEKGDQE